MDNQIPAIEELIKLFAKLPGWGPKSAKRIILKLKGIGFEFNKKFTRKLWLNMYEELFEVMDILWIQNVTQSWAHAAKTNNTH